MCYDIGVVGAGINGTTLAYMLAKEGMNVALFDTEIASGGSGAAGAFLSPKFLKSSSVKDIINDALEEAFEFYEQVDASLVSRHALLHIAKDERDAKNIRYMKEHSEITELDTPLPFIPQNEYVYTHNSALVDAKRMCLRLAEHAAFHSERIERIERKNGCWSLNGDKYRVRSLVLATGAYDSLVSEPYFEGALRGIWGHRIDVKSEFESDISIHQYVSISPSNKGTLSIGATHDIHFRPDEAVEYDYEKGREELIKKASLTVELGDLEVVCDYVGLRSGSIDHLPIIGKIAKLDATLQKLGSFELKRKKQNYDTYEYYENLYMINGSAGYGFVLAPMLARGLRDHILYKKTLDSRVEAARFLPRFVRRTL